MGGGSHGRALGPAGGLRPSRGLGSHWRVLGRRVIPSDSYVQSFPRLPRGEWAKGKGRGREPRRRPLQGGTRGWGGRGVAVQVLRNEEMPLRHLAAGLPNLDFRGPGLEM